MEYLASHTPAAKERCRVQALLGLDEGETPEQVAAALRVSRRTVYYWVERFHPRHDLGLRERLRDRHGIEVSGTTVGRAIARLRIRWKRPRHQLARRPDTWRQSKGG